MELYIVHACPPTARTTRPHLSRSTYCLLLAPFYVALWTHSLSPALASLKVCNRMVDAVIVAFFRHFSRLYYNQVNKAPKGGNDGRTFC